MPRIHAARELEAEISGWIDTGFAVGWVRACQPGRAFGDKRPVVAKRVSVAGAVTVAGLEDDLVVRTGEEGHVVIDELAAAEPTHGSDRGRRQAETRRDGRLIHVVVEGDADWSGGRDVDRVALRSVV